MIALLSARRRSQHNMAILNLDAVQELVCLPFELADTIQPCYEADRARCCHSYEQYLVRETRQNLSSHSRLLAAVSTFTELILSLTNCS